MKIGLLSDTHSHFDEQIYTYLKEVDEIWHAGDIGNISVLHKLQAFKPTRAVYGNIDGTTVRAVAPENNLFQCAGLKVLMTHIAGYPGKYSARVKSLILEHKPDVVICGHSHILKVMRDPVLQHLHLNPGAMGLEGFHTIKTMLRFSISDGKPTNMEVIELPKK